MAKGEDLTSSGALNTTSGQLEADWDPRSDSGVACRKPGLKVKLRDKVWAEMLEAAMQGK